VRILDRLTDPTERRCEKSYRSLQFGLTGRGIESLCEQVERLFGKSLFESGLRLTDEAGSFAWQITRRRTAQQTHCLLISKALRVESKDALKRVQCLVGPASSKVGNAKMVEGVFEIGSELGGPLKGGDRATTLAELESAESHQVPALRGIFDLQAVLEMSDSVAVSSAKNTEGTESEVGEKCVWRHLPGACEGIFGLVPLAEIRRDGAEVNQCFELGSAQLEDFSKCDAGSLEFSALKSSLADEGPELVTVRCHRREIGE
jgi:hypothetical protein